MQAKKCDEVRAKTQKQNWTFGCKWDMQKYFPPLYGIPISVKDTIDMTGFATTVGTTHRSRFERKDGVIMHGIRGSGMIPFIRTNAYQMSFTFETNNLLWGLSKNPWNRVRSVGGSSGGEGGLISVGGSPIGIGADLGGSIRTPAAFCGVFALKPGSTRISNEGHS